MHPFGGSPICPRCSKAVYAAEQAMGPGRRLYHKPCMACMACNKRLDSLTLVEHDQEPYCQPCYSKNFGTRDLRQANLPHIGDLHRLPSSNPSSPIKSSAALSTPTSPVNRTVAALQTGDYDRFSASSHLNTANGDTETDDEQEEAAVAAELTQISPPMPHTTLPTPASPTSSYSLSLSQTPRSTPVSARINAFGSPRSFVSVPLAQTPTGTRYGTVLGASTASPLGSTPTGTRQWGGEATPKCPRCDKSVYFAEQVKAVGRAWHKYCLRCTQCNTALDPGKLSEKDGIPFCRTCYNKLYGPQGNGYALLGKAGGN